MQRAPAAGANATELLQVVSSLRGLELLSFSAEAHFGKPAPESLFSAPTSGQAAAGQLRVVAS